MVWNFRGFASLLLLSQTAWFAFALPTSGLEGTDCLAASGKDTGCLSGPQSDWQCITGKMKQCPKGLVCGITKDAIGTIIEGCNFPPHPDVEHAAVGTQYPPGTKVKVGTTTGDGTAPIPNYCQIPLPTAELAAGSTSCIRGSQIASVYTSSGTNSACAGIINFTPGSIYAAAYHYTYPSESQLSNKFNTELCGKTLDVTNIKTGKTLTVTVVDNCPSCTGIAPAYESEWASINGATIDLDDYTFAALFDGATTGVFDVKYTPFEGDVTRKLATSRDMD